MLLFAEAEVTALAAILAAAVSLGTLGFGYLKVRDESKFTGERFELIKQRLEDEKYKLECEIKLRISAEGRIATLEKSAEKMRIEIEECRVGRAELQARLDIFDKFKAVK